MILRALDKPTGATRLDDELSVMLRRGLVRATWDRHRDVATGSPDRALRVPASSLVGLNNDIARSHLETLIERITGIEKAAPADSGEYFIKIENAGFFARVDGDEVPVIRVFSVVAKDVEKKPELLESLNEINGSLSFVRTMWMAQQVMFVGESLALNTDVAEFSQLCRTVAMASDHFGPKIVEAHGGKPFFEESKDPGYELPQPDQPGYL